jgi:hypothetical protein
VIDEAKCGLMAAPSLEEGVIEATADGLLVVVAAKRTASAGLEISHALLQPSEIGMVGPTAVGTAMS